MAPADEASAVAARRYAWKHWFPPGPLGGAPSPLALEQLQLWMPYTKKIMNFIIFTSRQHYSHKLFWRMYNA